MAHDVTDRKASEDALRAESAFRKAMEDSVLTGLRAIDLKGRIIYVNRAFCDLVGFAAEELIGQTPPFPYWPERDHELYWDKLRLSLAGKAPLKAWNSASADATENTSMCACTSRH